jgi:hypothetical protein
MRKTIAALALLLTGCSQQTEIWVLTIISYTPPQLFLNTFDSKDKCEARIKIMEPAGQDFHCIQTTLNK